MKKLDFDGAARVNRAGAKARSGRGISHRLRQFASQEDGNLTVMSVFMFVGIVAICGVGVDLMLNEMKRTDLQHTLDRAVLAAADLDQDLDPNIVVQDYFATVGLDGALTSVTVDQGLNYRTVSATAAQITNPLFLNVLGIDEMVAPAAGTAEERAANVEISLVVDVSGSMGWSSYSGGSKIQNLRNAAREFVDTVVQEDGRGTTTVSIIPYNSTVDLGSRLVQYYGLSRVQDVSRCGSQIWWSGASQQGALTVHSNDVHDLHAHINRLNAGGGTRSDVGMSWGVALLDPSAQGLVSDMISDGLVPPEAQNRPAAYNDNEAMKIIVLMTDGQNSCTSWADAQLARICNDARNSGITVYTMAFEAPPRAAAAMQNCASSPAHYFDVNGVQIADAFDAIARTINQLRLTQ